MLIVDPLTRTAQRLAPLLLAIQAVVPVHISLHLLPEAEAGEKALKRYYRLALHHTPRFTSDGRLVAPAAVFKGLPGNPLLTLGIDAPPAWDVMAEACAYDLDNLHPKDADNGLVRAEFALTHILVEGTCAPGDLRAAALCLIATVCAACRPHV
jgi:UDP-glucose:glycoprotein glucosyltransferase